MQSYLLEHNGVIDSWPYPVSATVRSSDWAQNNTLEFDYLGADYYTLSDCYVERISDQRIYQNEYHYVGNKPFQKMLAKEENLKRQVRAGKALRNPLVSLGFSIVFLLPLPFWEKPFWAPGSPWWPSLGRFKLWKVS